MSETSRPAKAMSTAQLVVVFVVVTVVIPIAITALVTVAIWPGEARLTAPLFCDEDHPDAFVVADHESFAGETATNYTLYCVGPRGDVQNAGWLGPSLVLTAAHGALWLAGVGVAAALYRQGAR